MEEYNGPERRIHKVFITRNSAYYLKSGICKAVKDLKSNTWLENHKTINCKVIGGLRFQGGGVIPKVGLPELGECIYFDCEGDDIVTSPVNDVQRPPKEVVKKFM